MTVLQKQEKARQELLEQLDAVKDQASRNKLGQFATPPSLAADIVRCALSQLGQIQRVRFLEPGFGTGPFYSALLRSVPASRVQVATAYEIDARYAEHSARLWSGTGLRLHLADFTKASPPDGEAERYNLVVCNPPYVRHHHLSARQKRDLQAAVAQRLGFQMNGLAGLYTYFMVLSQAWMSERGVGAWLVPSEFMDVNYGRKVKEFLTTRVTLHHIHRFDPNQVQFDDALVSSAVVIFSNALPPDNHHVEFSFGGTLNKPQVSRLIGLDYLQNTTKWSQLARHAVVPAKSDGPATLADLFTIKRGLATGCNSLFVVTGEAAQRYGLPTEFLQPILPSPRDLESDEIPADDRGEPMISKRRYLLCCNLPEERVQADYPALRQYLEQGKRDGIHERYLCRHREPWYSQENRPPAPFLCTYMGRPTQRSVSPFRFILNHSRATAANVYLMLYPKPRLAALLRDAPDLSPILWKALSSVTSESLVSHGRTYGGGLHKLEPKELASIPADAILAALAHVTRWKPHCQLSLFAP